MSLKTNVAIETNDKLMKYEGQTDTGSIPAHVLHRSISPATEQIHKVPNQEGKPSCEKQTRKILVLSTRDYQRPRPPVYARDC